MEFKGIFEIISWHCSPLKATTTLIRTSIRSDLYFYKYNTSFDLVFKCRPSTNFCLIFFVLRSPINLDLMLIGTCLASWSNRFPLRDNSPYAMVLMIGLDNSRRFLSNIFCPTQCQMRTRLIQDSTKVSYLPRTPLWSFHQNIAFRRKVLQSSALAGLVNSYSLYFTRWGLNF